MDIATLAGLIAGIIFVITGILSAGKLGTFYDFGSILITVGGSFSSLLISYPLRNIIGLFKVIKNVFLTKLEDPIKTIHKIIELANIARKEGLLALEEATSSLEDPFTRKGILLIVDGTDPELVRNILETELSYLEERHKQGQSILDTLGAMAPAYGMIGTLIGLINMLKALNDPSTLGPNMALALITTFYGSIIANLFCIPMSTKLKHRSGEEMLLKEIILEGILSINAGENPRIIEEKLRAFLPPRLRETENLEQRGDEIVA